MRIQTVSTAVAALLLATQAGAQTAPRGAADAADKLEASAEHLARMKTAMKTVIGRIDAARAEKDVVKLNCVNEKLAQIRSFVKVAEQAHAALREALASRDPAADAEFSKVGIARTKVEALRAQSEECAAQLSYVVDESTTVEVEQPAGLPADPEELAAEAQGRRPPLPPAPPVVRPPPASRWF